MVHVIIRYPSFFLFQVLFFAQIEDYYTQIDSIGVFFYFSFVFTIINSSSCLTVYDLLLIISRYPIKVVRLFYLTTYFFFNLTV